MLLRYSILTVITFLSLGCQLPREVTSNTGQKVEYKDLTESLCQYLDRDVELDFYFNEVLNIGCKDEVIYQEYQLSGFPNNTTPQWKSLISVRFDKHSIRNGVPADYKGMVRVYGHVEKENRKVCSDSVRFGALLRVIEITAID